jgi:Rv0078B-related antitoxin
MPRRPPVIEVIDDRMAALLRRKTGAEKLLLADAMYRSARQMVENAVRAMHPDWTDDQVRRETSRRVAGDTT